MAQRPKEHVRARFVEAAAKLFAGQGYPATTMAEVAERAGSSIGNLYKYFGSKDELFDAVVPRDFVRDVRRLTRARVEAVGAWRDIRDLPIGNSIHARYHVLAGELLDLCLANREPVVILLARAEGTPLAGFASDFARRLVAWAIAYAEKAWPELALTPQLRFALRRIYDAFLASIAEAFVAFDTEKEIRAAVAHLTAHHQGGLKHLFETADHERSRA